MKKLRHKIAGIVAFALLSTLLLASIPTVSATKPVEMKSYVLTIRTDVEAEELPSGLVKVTFHSWQVLSGDWEGDFISYGSGTADVTGLRKGLWIVEGWGTFTGQIKWGDGWLEGTVFIRSRATMDPERGYVGAINTIISGTGELENIRGHGFSIVEDATSAYIHLWIHFDPS